MAPEVGGGFGSKINIYGEEYVAAAVSKRLGLPVKWVEDRSEAFVATIHGRDILAYVDVAAKRDGTVLGIKMNLVADIGAYNMLLTAAIPTLTQAMASGTYAFPVIRATVTEVFTNKTPTDAYRGAGRPEAIYFVERSMDILARKLGRDPAELRRKNFIKPNQFPFTTQAGSTYDSGDYEKALDLALQKANWDELKAERDAAKADGRFVGLGLSMYVEVCGIGPSSSLPTGGWEHSQVTVERDGRISATTGASPHGQGNETTFAQMLADQFGVPLDHVTIHHGDTNVVKQGIGTFGSRSQAVGGAALHLAGGKVKKKMAKFAAALMEANEEDLVFENGKIGVKGAPGAATKEFSEVAAFAYVPVPLPEGLEPGLSEEAFFEPSNNTYPFGCHIAMLEVDRDTGEPTLLKLVAVDDAGNLINPLFVEGQIHGGLAQGIGQAMIEAMRGSFINIASMSAIIPLSRVVAYSAAKAAVVNLTRFLSREWAEAGVRVNAIRPGFFLAEQNRALLYNEDGSYSERGGQIIGHTPMARFGEPDELAGVAVWLASQRASSFVTGQNITVDGGFASVTI